LINRWQKVIQVRVPFGAVRECGVAPDWLAYVSFGGCGGPDWLISVLAAAAVGPFHHQLETRCYAAAELMLAVWAKSDHLSSNN